MASRRTATPAEISLVQLRNCLVNLPSTLVGILDGAKTPVQNCIVELQLRAPSSSPLSHFRSIFVGWTGFSSKSRASLTSSRNFNRDQPYGSSSGPTDTPTVELDSAFARNLNIVDGAKVGIVLHLDPHISHTVHIEPQSPADWDIIELHANFLETNLLAQIRALPNPQFTLSEAGLQKQDKIESRTHPLTIHLSPTSTANIIVTQLTPAVPKAVAFAKISPDSEVIVAPKTRTSASGKNDARSIVSGSARSGRTSGTQKQRTQRGEVRAPLFVRGVHESVHSHLRMSGINGGLEVSTESASTKTSLEIRVDNDLYLSNRSFRATEWVSVSVVSPAGLQASMDALEMQKIKELESSEAGPGAKKVVAKLVPWDLAPSRTCAVLSSQLCEALGEGSMCGSILRLEPATAAQTNCQSVKIYPFVGTQTKQTEGLKFGGETRASREVAAKRVRKLMGRNGEYNILNGPITDGMILPGMCRKTADGWSGGILKLTGLPAPSDAEKATTLWMHCSEDNISIDVQQDVPRPDDARKAHSAGEADLTLNSYDLIGFDGELNSLKANLTRGSSTLLTGGQGSGKTSISKALAECLRNENLCHISFFSCGNLVADEIRVPAVKEVLQRIFMKSNWGSRLGGTSVVILDDLDKLCPAEQELQVGNDNARSRQISEILRSLVRQYCGRSSNVALVATARGKDTLHNVVVGGHLMPESVELKAPDKMKRRQILHSLLASERMDNPSPTEANDKVSNDSDGSWMDGEAVENEQKSPRIPLDRRPAAAADLLDIAGRTDGYMPADLHLLFSRARSEAMSRTILNPSSTPSVELEQADFENALDGFIPASLRNVTLQSSSTTFSAIGGLRETRKTLLETLQYPTTYAPIFNQCPLRLRSGLLLYGYPGCGKTLLASAVAGECGLNFISVKGPEILNKYIGASEKSVRDLFERAQAARPCVLFFDEFDSIAPKRGHDSTGVTDRVVNQLLTQMDGAEGLSGVYVLAATSRPDLIDPALLRPGRLDKSLLCDMPDQEDRLDILRALGGNLQISPVITEAALDSSTSLHEIARQTHGYSGADLQAVIYNAHLEAIHDVLNGRATTNGTTSTEATKAAVQKPGHRQHSSSSLIADHHDLIQFRYGLEEDRKSSAVLTGPKAATERATLLAKLETERSAKRRDREARRIGNVSAVNGNKRQSGTNDVNTKDIKAETEVIIEWRHVEESLKTTRSSISSRERTKLQVIYNEFVQGRNGEMPSGQGPMEVGARSSLM